MSEKCTSCKQDLPNDHVICSDSGCKLHFECAGIKETSWRRADKAKWKCHMCRVKKPEGDSRNTISSTEMREFMSSVLIKLEKLEKLEKMAPVIENLEKGVQFLSDKYDEMCEKVQTHEQTISELKKDAEEKDKIINDLQMRMIHSEQYARNRNIEIINVEQRPAENLVSVVEKLANEMGVDYADGDIDVVHRVPTRNRDAPPKIIVQFKTRTLHANWMAKRHQGVEPKKVVPDSTSTKKIRIFRHLSEHWRTLLWEARQKGAPLGYTVVWYKDNKILAKKGLDDTNVKVLLTAKDLSKLQ